MTANHPKGNLVAFYKCWNKFWKWKLFDDVPWYRWMNKGVFTPSVHQFQQHHSHQMSLSASTLVLTSNAPSALCHASTICGFVMSGISVDMWFLLCLDVLHFWLVSRLARLYGPRGSIGGGGGACTPKIKCFLTWSKSEIHQRWRSV